MDYIINTGLIPRESFETGFEDFIYDFNIISMSKEKGDMKLTTDGVNQTGIFVSENKINNCIVNFKIMLESSNVNNNHLYLGLKSDTTEQSFDLVNDFNIEVHQQTSQSDWYEITLLFSENTTQIIINDELFNEFSDMFNESYLMFVVENNTSIQTINIKDFNYQDLTGRIIFNDVGENIHWTSDDSIERIFKDDYTQVKGTGYTRPNYDDVYTETKLYKNKNHMIEFDYKHNIDDLIVFNDLGTSSSHNTHYNRISGLLSYTSTDTVFTYTNNDILNLNYYIPQCELKGDWTIDFKLKTSNLSRTYFVFTNELRDTVPSEDDISAEQYKTDLTGLNINTEYHFKILKIDNQITIKYSTDGNTYDDFKTLAVDEESLYFNFVLNGMGQYDATINFSDMVIYNSNKLSLILSNYDHSAETLVEKLSLSENANIKILLIGDKVFLLINNIYKKSLIMKDDYAYTLFNFMIEDGIFDYNNFKMYELNNNDDFKLLNKDESSIIDEQSLYHYVIEVYNKLWTGEVTFDRLSENEDIILYTDNKLNYNNETYIFHTICSDDDFDIILKLNNLYDGERIFEDIKPAIEYKDDSWIDKYKMFYTYKMSTSSDKNSYSYVYYNEPNITITVKDMYGEKLQGAKVIVPSSIYDGQTTLTTDDNGQVVFKPKRLKPNTYNAEIVIKKDPFDSEQKNITYDDTSLNIQLKPQKENLSITYTKGATFWGGYVNDTIKVNANTNYSVKVTIECGKSLINSKVNKTVNTNSSFTHEQSYRTKRLKESTITISVKGNDWCNAYKKSFTKKHSLKYVDNWTQLKNEINNTKGVDIVGLKNKNYIVDDDVIFYKRDMEIVGENTNNGWAVIKNAKKLCFENKSPSKSNYIDFKISNVEFYNNVKVFNQKAYANLEITNCLFYKNGKNGKSNIGICIETPITDTYIDKNYGSIKVTSCSFINNKGSNIGTSMNININTCRFGLNDWDYAQHPQCWAMEIYGQKATVKDCDFAVSMSGKSPLANLRHSNFSHGKAILRIGTSAYVNNTKGSSCKKNNSSPLLHNGNTSYIYAKYKYDGVNVTASPTRNHERSAHDIVVNGTDWAWKNNVNVSTVYDNTKEKPKITVPKSPKDNAKILKKGGRQKW